MSIFRLVMRYFQFAATTSFVYTMIENFVIGEGVCAHTCDLASKLLGVHRACDVDVAAAVMTGQSWSTLLKFHVTVLHVSNI
jgi:hypothetical protein